MLATSVNNRTNDDTVDSTNPDFLTTNKEEIISYTYVQYA